VHFAEKRDKPHINQDLLPNLRYEGRSVLARLNLQKVNRLFERLRQPLETDEKCRIIDFNWQVDKILKNSQSYNKEPELVVASLVKKKGGPGQQERVYAFKGARRQHFAEELPQKRVKTED
jgi:hypothetical protein